MRTSHFLLAALVLLPLFALNAAQLSSVQEKAVRNSIEAAKKNLKKITSLKIDCVDFQVDENSTSKATQEIQIEVRERHNVKCGGSPDTAPRITTLTVKLKSGKITFKEMDDEGTLKEVPLN